MTREELLVRLRQHEDPFIERKTTPHASDVIEALVAFANSLPLGREAVLLLGIQPNGTVVGVDDADKLQRSISEWAKEQCYPPIAVTYEVLADLAPRSVLAVIVRASDERPHFVGPAYVRDGSRTVKASRKVYEDLIASRNDKARVILRYKQQGGHITVMLVGKAYGRVSQTEVEAEIEDCTAHWVTVRYVGPGCAQSFPLERVDLTDDPVNHRALKLIINPI
ncbi:MAG TPA: ATP-binding protein [bacterium]|nr:ATP-binding protein [bacterium]